MSDTHPSLLPRRRLPENPNLEQLHKQAKDLLRAYRAGDAVAIAEVTEFEREPSPETFALNDAQRVLARAYGFSSWPKLKAFVDGATVAQFLQRCRLLRGFAFRIQLLRKSDRHQAKRKTDNQHEFENHFPHFGNGRKPSSNVGHILESDPRFNDETGDLAATAGDVGQACGAEAS